MECEEIKTEECELEEDQGYHECAEEQDQGYEDCAEWQDQGSSQCSEWADYGYSKCCGWKPCKWFCDALVWVSNWVCNAYVWISSWVCLGWYWVSNWVCVSWTWIEHKVCVAWKVTKNIVCHGWNAIVWAIGILLNTAAFIVNLIFLFPGLGPLLRWAWNVILTAVWGVMSLGDMVGCGIFDWCPKKKLRLLAVIMVGERHEAMTQVDAVMPHIQNTITLYDQLADVEVVPALDDGRWVVISNTPAPGYLLDVECGASCFLNDLGLVGTGFDFQVNVNNFHGSFRKLIGYGSPLIAFYVRTIEGVTRGCSLGPLSDYLTIESRPLSIALPHEVGHSCNLGHSDQVNNMMRQGTNYTAPGIRLKKSQVVLLRASRHVTFF